MKKIKLLSLVSTALVGLAQPTWAGPHGGGGGFGGGGFAGGGHPSAPNVSSRASTATIARAAAVEVCEPRQGREAAALSIPSRRRGFLPGA